MKLAHNIGDILHSNYNTRQQIINCNDEIGFDGIYLNVYENQEILLNKKGIFFVMGNYIGKDNSFDLQYVPKLEKYCTMEQIDEMVSKYNFFKGWHTWSHPDLTKLNYRQIMDEIKCPFDTDYFAYPYGKFNELVIDCVKEYGYKFAYSVTQGSINTDDIDYNFKIYRDYIF